MAAWPTIILSTDRPAPALAVLAETHPDLPAFACDTYQGLPRMIEETGADIVFTIRFAGSKDYPRAALVESGSVRWVAVGGSGTDHLRPWDPAHVTVTNSAGVSADMMAEYAIGAMLSFSLDLRGFGRKQAAKDWDRAAKVEPIAGRTLLILGLGKTGEAVARRAKAMELRVLGVRARPRPTPNVDTVYGMEDLPRVWPQVDFVVCCVPLLDTTRGLIGRAAFAALKPSAVLVDVSRGGVVDQPALIEALAANRLKGAALDVFATEPLPPDNPLWAFDNVIVTPHCSAVYDGWDVKSVQRFAENLTRYREGRPLINIVDPMRGY